jgi:hypothetical protein
VLHAQAERSASRESLLPSLMAHTAEMTITCALEAALKELSARVDKLLPMVLLAQRALLASSAHQVLLPLTALLVMNPLDLLHLVVLAPLVKLPLVVRTQRMLLTVHGLLLVKLQVLLAQVATIALLVLRLPARMEKSAHRALHLQLLLQLELLATKLISSTRSLALLVTLAPLLRPEFKLLLVPMQCKALMAPPQLTVTVVTHALSAQLALSKTPVLTELTM